jgi:hypothetical protein
MGTLGRFKVARIGMKGEAGSIGRDGLQPTAALTSGNDSVICREGLACNKMAAIEPRERKLPPDVS